MWPSDRRNGPMTIQMPNIMGRALRTFGGRALSVTLLLTVGGACHLLDVSTPDVGPADDSRRRHRRFWDRLHRIRGAGLGWHDRGPGAGERFTRRRVDQHGDIP